jgi:SAM-dependent methyltransferase
MENRLICRTCQSTDIDLVLDLGLSPIANRYITSSDFMDELVYPLAIAICNKCKIVQTTETLPRESIFEENYAYFSSTSSSWLRHSKEFAGQVTERFALSKNSRVVEIASNDGYLLQFFKELDIQVMGVEPTISTASVAHAMGIPTIVDFFGATKLGDLRAKDLKNADLIVANNVLAHVPDLKDFIHGMKEVLNQEGVISIEIPHLMEMVRNNAFDTIYHEHYSYFSILALDPLFKGAGLRIFDVEDIPTHGGSIRVFVCHEDSNYVASSNVSMHIEMELNADLGSELGFREMQTRATCQKDKFLEFLSLNKDSKICGYGAAAKGNTFLNFCSVGVNEIVAVFDAAQAKQGLCLPGSKIPVLNPVDIRAMKPDFLVIFPWNIASEVIEQTSFINEWGGRHVIAMPTLKIF